MGSESLTAMPVYLFSKAHLNLALPFLLSLWMAWSDIKTRRIPNYLTLGCALAGLAYQLGFYGLKGLGNGFLGMGLGLVLLIFFYLRGGMGAGDVKALAALGAWLGPWQTFLLFIYMAISGGVILVVLLWWRGLLWGAFRQIWGSLVSWVLLRPHPSEPKSAASPALNPGVPYAVALAMGMAALCFSIISWKP